MTKNDTPKTHKDTDIPEEWKATAYAAESAVTMLHKVKNLDNPTDYELRTTWFTLSLTKIGDYAFNGVVEVKTFDIPKTVNKIGTGAFSDCVSMTSFKVPEGINTIKSISAKVNKANGSCTVSMEGWTYGGTAKSPSASSTTNSGATVTYTYYNSSEVSIGSTKPTTVGTYYVTATFAATTKPYCVRPFIVCA